LLREAGLLNRLAGNPHYAKYFGLGRVDDEKARRALVMQLVPGAPLASTPATRADPKKAARIAISELEAVCDLNRLGRRHGDLNPANVMVDDELVRLIDLAVAGKLRTRYPWGGRIYYAPEQTAKGRSTNGDVYSIGKHLLELVTGEPRNHGLSRVRDASLRAIIARAIDPNPETRYQTPQAMIEAISGWI
jgi:serine/threonine protein kinase